MNRWYFGAALELVLLLGRHGVRSPLQTPAELAPYAAQAWPQWPVAPGILTAHGAQVETQVGRYFREHYVTAGLLSGNAAADARVIVLRSDSDQRTMESARLLGAALAPGQTIPLESPAPGVPDPLFSPVKVQLGHPDAQHATAAVLGRMGGNPELMFAAHRATFAHLQHALFGESPPAPGKEPLLAMHGGVVPGTGADLVTMSGQFRLGLILTDALLLEYENGMPHVGWGRVSAADLQDFFTLHALYFDLTQKTLDCAQVQGSNLAQHLLDTFRQAASGQAVPGAIGRPGARLVVALGHDTNIINIAGLLGLHWIMPGTQTEPVLPSGQLVFELWRTDDGRQRLRVAYVAPTLDELRSAAPLDAAHPPAVIPIFIPGCSEAGPGYEAPLEAFAARLRAVVNPRYVGSVGP